MGEAEEAWFALIVEHHSEVHPGALDVGREAGTAAWLSTLLILALRDLNGKRWLEGDDGEAGKLKNGESN